MVCNFDALKKAIYILFFLCLQAAYAGNSDNGKNTRRVISGKITDVNGQSLAGASILIAETGEVFFSNLEGNYMLVLKTDKEYSVSINSLGFKPLELKASELRAFNDLSLNEL